MTPSDDELVAAYLEHGDQQAFRTLVERHQERIFGYLMGMVGNRQTANDLFQDTFLRVIDALQERRGNYEQQGRWLAWVMRIARNRAVDYLRRRKKWTDVSNGEADDDRSFWEALPAEEESADEHLHRAQQRNRLTACIRQLPPEQREVLLLRQETDLTFREIGELTEVSINTALGRMRYALKNLRKMLDADRDELLVNEVSSDT